MRIYNNMASIDAYNNLVMNNGKMNQAMKRLSTGMRINSAQDDAAGLAQSTNMRAQVALYSAAAETNEGLIEYLNVADGALATAGEIIQTMAELVLRGNDPSLTTQDKFDVALEYNALAGEVAQILMTATGATGSTTKFNGQVIWNTGNITAIVDGSGQTMGILGGAAATAAIGYGGLQYSAGASITLTGGGLGSMALTDAVANTTLLSTLVATLTNIATQRGAIGAIQSRLTFKSEKNIEMATNLQAFESRLRDADMAKEASNFTKYQILVQSTQSMLAQANQVPQNVLRLLQ